MEKETPKVTAPKPQDQAEDWINEAMRSGLNTRFAQENDDAMKKLLCIGLGDIFVENFAALSAMVSGK